MRPLLFLALLVGAACACTADQQGTAPYCAAVAEHADVMASQRGEVEVADKRAAMAELRDLAPAEIRSYWDTWYLGTGDAAATDLARERISQFEDAHCS